MWTRVYVGLGGNVGDSCAILQKALERIASFPEIKGCKASRFYFSTPVSSIDQDRFVNAVCSFNTCLPPHALLDILQRIERDLGKVPKPKEAPRPIDLDILFFGEERLQDGKLEIPHPRWEERLFVLSPLSDLTDELIVPLSEGGTKKIDLKELLKSFQNLHSETVTAISF